MSSRGLLSVATRSAAASVLARGAGILVGIVLTPFVLGRLGLNLYGILTATGSAFEYLVLLRGGLGTAMKRHVTIRVHRGQMEDARRHYQAGFWWGLLLRAPILAVGLIVAEPLCRFMKLPPNLLADAGGGVGLLIVAAVLTDISSVFEVPIYATGDTSRLSLIRTGGALLRLVLVPVGFLLFLPSLTLYGGILILLALLVALGCMAASQKAHTVGPAVPKPSLGNREIRRELFSYGGLALLGQGASLLYVTTDNLLIGRIYGTAEVTFYSLGARWLPMVSGFVSSMIQPLTPLFTRLEAEDRVEQTRIAVRRAVAVTSSLAVPSCLVLCVIGDLFLKNWVGPQYVEKAWPILIASLAPAMLDISLAPVWTVLAGRGRIGWLSAGDMIVALGNVGLSLFLALPLHLGILGFALGNTAALLAKNLLLRPLAGRREPAMPGMGSLFLSMGKALLGGAPALILLVLLRGVYGHALWSVITAGLVGGALCLLGSSLVAIGRPGMMALVQSFRGGSARAPGEK